jgi:hypothetical protein
MGGVFYGAEDWRRDVCFLFLIFSIHGSILTSYCMTPKTKITQFYDRTFLPIYLGELM